MKFVANPISAVKFIAESNSYKGIVITATYKKGTLVSLGEGGNRHVYMTDHPLSAEEIHSLNEFNPPCLHKATHIWADQHGFDKKYLCFISPNETMTAEVKQILSVTASKDNGWCYDYTTEDFEKLFTELIKYLK